MTDEAIPYEIIKGGTTIGCSVMTPAQMEYQRTVHPQCTYIPLIGVAITSEEE